MPDRARHDEPGGPEPASPNQPPHAPPHRRQAERAAGKRPDVLIDGELGKLVEGEVKAGCAPATESGTGLSPSRTWPNATPPSGCST